MVHAFFLLADQPIGITQTQALYGAIGLIFSGLLTFAGVVFTAVWQRRTADKAAETERKISLFEEQDRLYDRAQREIVRLSARTDALEVETERLRDERDTWRRRARVAEDKVDEWIEKETP